MFELYNTLTQRAEPAAPGRRLLRIYSCGPAWPGRLDLGDLRSALVGDLIQRHGEHRHGLTVLTAQSVSDLAGRGDGEAAPGPAEDPADAFRAGLSALNLRPAELSLPASAETGLLTGLVSRLIEDGHAYGAPGGSVFFDAGSYPGYGELCGQGSGPDGPGPDGSGPGRGAGTPADWAVWTGEAGDELAVPAPYGAGFPARSTECAALALHHLGGVIDIHTGAAELCARHHEHERAVSDSAAGHAVVRLWVHAGRLRFEGAAADAGALRLPVLAERGLDPLALRLALLGHHYRAPQDLTWAGLDAADQTLRDWRGLVARWATSPSQAMPGTAAGEINAAFDADLDTPAALRALRQAGEDPQLAPGAKFELFAHADQLLGLDLAREVGRA